MIKHAKFQNHTQSSKDQVISGLRSGDENIPLQGVSIFVEILDMVSQVQVKQRYKNTSGHAVESTYCFPIEPGAAINGFNANIGGQIVKGVVKNRDEAFEYYDEAIEEGSAAFLLDQEKEDVFIASVGNLKPNEEAEIEISYLNKLDIYRKKVQLSLPTTVSPRYAPAGSDPFNVDKISPPLGFQVPYGLSIEVHIANPQGINMLNSPSHKIRTSIKENEMIVYLNENEKSLDRDFILEFEAERFAQPRAVISRHSNGERAVMVNWIPDIKEQVNTNQEGIFFIIDCSGSMNGSSIRQAKEALNHCITNMVPGTPFNIITFGSNYRILFDEMQLCSPASREKALSFVNKIHANMGGTEILKPLQVAYSMMGDGSFNIFLLTDGEVYNTEEVISLAQQNKRKARVFGFGIGYGPAHALVGGIARVSGGASVFISPDESIKEKVVRQFERLSTPRVTDIEIDWGNMKTKKMSLELPAIFSGEPFTVFALVEEGIEKVLKLKGKIGKETIYFPAPVVDIGENDLVPVMWAKQRIQDLETGSNLTRGSQQIERKAKGIKKEIENIALNFQLMSSQTSFVAIAERENREKSFEQPAFVRIPIQLTRDWHGINAELVVFETEFDTREENLLMESRILDKSKDFLQHKTLELSHQNQPIDIHIEKNAPQIYKDLLKHRGQDGEFQWSGDFLTKYGFPEARLYRLSFRVEKLDQEKGKIVIMTIVAILLLEKLKFEGESKRKIIREAEHWIETHAKDVFILGKPVQQWVERLIDFSRILQ